jgi:hypothetical protein
MLPEGCPRLSLPRETARWIPAICSNAPAEAGSPSLCAAPLQKHRQSSAKVIAKTILASRGRDSDREPHHSVYSKFAIIVFVFHPPPMAFNPENVIRR